MTKPKRAPETIIDKVKWDLTKVRIEYQLERTDGRFDELLIASFDLPTPAFTRALEALWTDVCTICEFDPSYREGLVIRGVSFSYPEGVMGACVTALKSVSAAKSPLVINTPFLTAGPMNEGDPGPFFDPATVTRLEALQQQAIAYINGERQQPSLDLKDDDHRS